MFDIYWSDGSGNITYFICPVALQDYMIKDHVIIGVQRKCISGDIMFLIYCLVLQDQVTQGPYGFMLVFMLLILVVIGTPLVEIKCFFKLSRHLARPRKLKGYVTL